MKLDFKELEQSLLDYKAKSEYQQAAIIMLRNIFKEAETKQYNIHDVVVPKGTLCLCGQPELPQYSPCCSLRCWHDQFD